MNSAHGDFGGHGMEWADAGGRSFTALSAGAQALAAEASEYTRKSIEAGRAAVEDLLSARSLESAIDIQAAFARQSYAAFIAEAVRIGELYVELARDAYKPFESMAAGTR